MVMKTPARMKKIPMPFSLGMKVLPKQTVNAPSQVMMMEDTKTCHGLETKSACLTAYICTVMLPRYVSLCNGAFLNASYQQLR